ncbi:MAG: peptide chain release factor-like protein [Nitrospirae bacterium]|nr:peptide chain release factor-like protein [Nitrospirota bacterium]
MPIFPVSPSKEDQLTERMRKLGVREEDLEESFIRSSGPGGQNVNKTSTAVVLVHRPSGLTVRCQEARSQGLNRFLARRVLLDRIEGKKLGALSAERQRIEKIRRQKRKRSRRAKEKMLANKRHQSEKKRERAAVRS